MTRPSRGTVAVVRSYRAVVTEPTTRAAGRIIVLDEQGRTLLLNCFDPAEPDRRWWAVPGGGLEPGESFADAAVRELREETGVAVEVERLGEPVFEETVDFCFNEGLYHQRNVYFQIRIPHFEPSDGGYDEIERRSTLGTGWWSAAELRRTTESYFPPSLPDLMAAEHRG